MAWKRATAGTAPGRTVALQFGITLLRLGFPLGDGLLDRFQAKLQLLFRQPLGLRAPNKTGSGALWEAWPNLLFPTIYGR